MPCHARCCRLATHALQVERLKAAHDAELDGLQSELDAANGQLAAAQDQLSEAQITIQERQFMVLSHQRSEHALAAHAQRLTSELVTCVQDLGALYGKLGEAMEVMGQDRWGGRYQVRTAALMASVY